ncbi:MAG: molybdopterin biosynthesis protein [Nitrospirae bacterium GWB2_47_37]|nr:MAG: molybdopterin biosynthesis protein [Nitrospirae bacterium GWA2_46_11]OGW24163.1 MAG: molybdopterin biosynthesis protein [Nitrospirae bacterium GWB2_47_37]
MKQVFLDTLSLEDARRLLFSRLNSIDLSLPSEKVDVRNSAGRITAEAVFARYSSPFYHSAAMDGYAVRFSDTFTASETSPSLLRIGYDAVYVDTGDPMPEGFNAVVMVEDINIIRREGMGDGQEDECIEIYEPVTPYQHVRTIGEDIVATELIIPENHEIRAIDAGAMLASGHTEISVRKMPKIAIIPTGTEIVEPDVVKNRPPAPPEIIEYNSSVLSGLAHESGAETVRFNIVRDDMEDIKKAIDEASKTCDIVLVNAGSGRGSEDYTLAAVKELGEVIINGVSIKPGKPFIAGFVNNRPVFGIPGYPVSAYLTFQLFVKPVISRILGVALKEKEKIKAVISRQIASPMGVDEFIRVKVGVVNDKYIATPAGRGAGLLMSLVRADGIIRIPADTEALSAGTEVEVELIRDKNEIKNTIVCIGSHDNTMDILANAVKKKYPQFSLSSAHVGSMGGLTALKRGEAHFAGTHLLDEQSGEYNIPFIKRLLADRKIVLVNLVYRQQGFLVKKGNPKNIKGFEDLMRDDVIFINRQGGSGTRLLLDKHLRELGINPYMIKGYDREEYTHMAVASAVLTGLADTGIAVYSSAVALGLDFIPVANERYDLAIPSEFMDMEMIKILLEIIREDKEFRATVEALGGYDTRDMGKAVFEG